VLTRNEACQSKVVRRGSAEEFKKLYMNGNEAALSRLAEVVAKYGPDIENEEKNKISS